MKTNSDQQYVCVYTVYVILHAFSPRFCHSFSSPEMKIQIVINKLYYTIVVQSGYFDSGAYETIFKKLYQ